MPEFTAHQHLTFWRGRLRNPRFVYVIGTRRKAPIKIGVAKEPEARLRELQTGNPNKLRLLYVVPGGRSLDLEALVKALDDEAIDTLFGESDQIQIILRKPPPSEVWVRVDS